MKKSIIILIVLSVLFVTCENHVFDNPVDPESLTYTGVESVDMDNDGIGSYDDVDEITIAGPVDGIIISDTASPVLTIQLLNPEVITKYRIQISTDSSFASNIVFDSSTLTSNFFTVPAGTLANNTTYYWRAMAFDGTKWSDGWSGSSSFTVDIDTEVPMFPSPTDGSSTIDTTPTLDWEDISGATGYHIQVNTVSDFTGTVIADDDTLLNSNYPGITILENNSTYYWRVKIKDSDALWGDWSSVWSFVVDMEEPTSPSPSNGSSTIDTTPLLDWGNIATATSYEIEISTVNDFSSILETDNGVVQSQYQMGSVLDNNTAYYWRVRTYNEDNVTGDWSNTWSFVVDMEEANIPLFPVDGSTIIDKTPLIDWSDVGSADKYEIQISEFSDFSIIMELNNTLIQSNYQMISILPTYSTYYWRVRIQDANGIWGDWSTHWIFNKILVKTKSIIATDFDAVDDIHACDLDGDGDTDILGAAFNSDKISWWENDGSENFTEHIVDSNFNAADSVYACDLNGDGYLDIIGGARYGMLLSWWENDGSESFTEHIIDNTYNGGSIYADDVDEDGDIDLLVAYTSKQDISWWENAGNGSFTEHIINDFCQNPDDIISVDLDEDGDIDIIATSGGDYETLWWENDGNENFTEHFVDSSHSTLSLYTSDIDDDGDIDILGSSAWWENNGNESFTLHIISSGSCAVAADIDHDGDIDLLQANRDNSDMILWENDGNESFTQHVIDGNFGTAHKVLAIDIDSDGDLDVLGAGRTADEISWWDNSLY